jgi:hypothetical protein
LHHVLLLAQQRGVPVEQVDGLAFSCVGLIHPRFSRAAAPAAPIGMVRPEFPVSLPISGSSGRTMPGGTAP